MSNMIGQLLNHLGLGDGSLNSDNEARRRYIRHVGYQAEVEVADHSYSVHDWSIGGVAFDAAKANVREGDSVNFVMRFRLPLEVITIHQPGRVVRAISQDIAAAFDPLTDETRRQFERVVDSYNAQGFLESQVA